MKHEHRLGWHESFLPLGPALRGPVIDIDPKWLDWRDFEKGDKGRQEQAVAPTPAAPVHPSGVAPFKAGDRVQTKGSKEPATFSHYSERTGGAYIIFDDPRHGYIVSRDGVSCGFTPDSIELLPAPREQVAEPLVRQPDSDGWIVWTPGAPPTGIADDVDVRGWDGDEIVAYRVVS